MLAARPATDRPRGGITQRPVTVGAPDETLHLTRDREQLRLIRHRRILRAHEAIAEPPKQAEQPSEHAELSIHTNRDEPS